MRTASILALALVLSFSGRRAPGQVVQVSGGSSTLDQTRGGEVSVHGSNYAASLGGGSIGGEFFAGGRVTREFEHSRFTLGSTQIAFDLPTDLFDSGHYLSALGAGFGTQSQSSHTYVFAGYTATGYNSPFFHASELDKPALILRVADKQSEHTEVSASIVLASSITMLGSLEWKSDSAQTKFATTVGFGAGQPYGAVSMSVHRKRYDLDAAYIGATGNFRRVEVKTPLNSEPDRENVVFTMRLAPKAGFTLSRQNFLSPVYQTDKNTLSTVTQGTLNIQVDGVDFAATISHSTFKEQGNLASFVSANRSLGARTSVQVAYLRSRPSFAEGTSAFVGTLQQTLSPRWAVSGTVNRSNGQGTFGMGGSFLSNLATVSAEYQTFYVPARVASPFEQALILNTQFHLFGRVTLSGYSFVAPDGKILYSTGGDGIVSTGAPAPDARSGQSSFGQAVLRGRVLTPAGNPVMGAAIQVDQAVIYTDSRGCFEVRERKPRNHVITVLGDRFLEGGVYRAVIAPTSVWSSKQGDQEAFVIVQRLPSLQHHDEAHR